MTTTHATHSPQATLVAGAALSASAALLPCSVDSLTREGYRHGRVSLFDVTGPMNGWRYFDTDFSLVSCCTWSRPDSSPELRCVLGEEGTARLYGPGGNPDRTFQIPDAGVWRKGAKGYGYVQRIRQVGQSLFVCGAHRQVYRYLPGERNPLSGRFVDIAGPMRQPPLPRPPQHSGPAFSAWANADIVLFNDIAGTGESDLYATGDETWHFDGTEWTQLDLGIQDETMHVIKVLDPARVLIGGSNGYLFIGNAADGFRNASSVDDNQTITGLEWFDDRLYVATESGLFTHDAQTQRLVPVVTGLAPELQDAHLVEAKDGVLWSFGRKDLAYLDGRASPPRWVRVHHPDNPRIGAPRAEQARSGAATAEAPQAAPSGHGPLLAWLPEAGAGQLDLAGLMTRVGHARVGKYVCEQLSPFGLAPGQILKIARMQRYTVEVPGLGLALVMHYAGPKRPGNPPESRPEDWGLAEVHIRSAAAHAGTAWTGPWPGGIDPGAAQWQRAAADVWGEPGFVGQGGQTHFVPGALGAQWAIKLVQREPDKRLAEMQVVAMGDFLGR